MRTHNTSSLFLSILIAVLLLMAACDVNITAVSTPTPHGTPPAGTPSATASPHPTSVIGTGRSTAALAHTPQGSGDLIWDPTDHSLHVALSVIGLAPRSTHPTEVRAGSCAAGGAIVFGLPDLVADDQGTAHSLQSIDQLSGGIPGKGWYLAIHNAPGTDVYARMLIGCTNITNATTATNKQQTVHVIVTTGQGTSQAASGSAQLAISNDRLIVTVTLRGLEARSTHPAEIRIGGCAEQSGQVAHTLTSLTASSTGTATVTTTLENVSSIPVSGWYIVAHRGTNLGSQIDFDPIVCGNVTPA